MISLLFFFLYVMGLVLISFLASKKQTEEGFMLSDRKVSGILLTSTLAADFFDGSILAAYIGFIYLYGFSAIVLFLGLILGFLLLRKLSHRIKAKADTLHVYSMPEYFFKLFGKRTGLLFSFITIIGFAGILIINLIVSGKILSTIFPISYEVGVGIGGIIVLSYLVLSGFKAVVRTDFFQVILMFFMVVSIAGYLTFKNPEVFSTQNIGSIGIIDAFSFLILGVFTVFTAADLWQRIFAAKDIYVLKRSLNGASLIILLLTVVVSVVGIVTRQHFPGLKPEDALIVGLPNILPVFLKELGLVLLYSVSLSSTDSATFVISSIVTSDLKNYTKTYSKSSMKVLTRVFIFALLIATVLIAILYRHILDIMFSLASISVGLFPVVFGSLFWKLREKAVFYSLLLSVIAVGIVFGSGYINPQTSLISLPVSLFSLIFISLFLKFKEIRN